MKPKGDNYIFEKIHPQLHGVARKAPRITFNRVVVFIANLLLRLTPAPKSPEDISIENITIRNGNGNNCIRLRIYRPISSDGPTPAMLWMHGGGYVIGNPEMCDHHCVHYVRALGVAVISVDYRRASRHPFPAALEDCYSALQWVVSQAEAIGVDSDRIAIGGQSAGGGLAAALSQLAYDRKEIKPAFQLLIYPMLDDRTTLRTDIDDVSNITWNHKSNHFGWRSYLATTPGAEGIHCYAAPARRHDLTGLPPAWIGVGTLDIFHDENVAYAQQLKRHGGTCEIHVVDGAFHGFDIFSPTIPIVKEFMESQILALRKHLF